MTFTQMNLITIFDDLDKRWHTCHDLFTCEAILQQAILIQQIPAPTFDERQRANVIQSWFEALGLEAISQDELFNVYGWLNFSANSTTPLLLISAHLDTVFPIETDLQTQKTSGRIYGAGLGDNSLGVAGLYLLAKLLGENREQLPDVSICFVANSREEGLGNLEGMREVIVNLTPQRIAAAIVIEGMALGRIYHGGIAVRRLKITTHTDGGHSWSQFGNPSAIHSLVQFAAEVTRLSVPQSPRTTYNIGLIEGGQSVNSIASEATCYLDLRSEQTEALNALENQVRDLVEKYRTAEVRYEIERVGDRPAGDIPAEHLLVQLAIAAQSHIQIVPTLASGSTDANVLLAQGIPSVVVGITYGANAHRTDEYIETAPLQEGFWQLFLLVLSVLENFQALQH